MGIGNPNAKILFVGKEPAIDKNNEQGLAYHSQNGNFWNDKISNNEVDIYEYDVDADHVFRVEKSWGKNTWSKYQQLTDLIMEKDTRPNYIDFLKVVFTTELNNAPSKTTQAAEKESLNERKTFFKNSQFIQDFPIVVLACSDYIQNNDKVREIDEVFGVEYVPAQHAREYSSGNWYFPHYNQDKTKLVIHTRQLSANVDAILLEDIAKEIKAFLDMNN